MWLLAKMRQIAARNDKIGQHAEQFTDCRGGGDGGGGGGVDK